METEVTRVLSNKTKDKFSGILVSDKNGQVIMNNQMDPKFSSISTSIMQKVAKLSNEDFCIEIQTTNQTILLSKQDNLYISTRK